MYNGEKVVEFPTDPIKVSRSTPARVPFKINNPSEKGYRWSKGVLRSNQSGFVKEYTFDWKSFRTIASIGFSIVDDFEEKESMFNLTGLARSTQWKSGGMYAMRTNYIGNRQSTQGKLTLRLDEPSTVSFDYASSSEGSYDWFNVYLNGSRVIRQSGGQPWRTYSVNLPAGNHEFIFQFTKDGSGAGGYDGGFIDNFKVTTNSTASKFLIKKANKLYRYTNRWEEVTNSGNLESDLNLHGMLNLSQVPSDAYAFFGGDFNVVTLTDKDCGLMVQGHINLPYKYSIQLDDEVVLGWSDELQNITTDLLVRIFAADMEGSATKELKVLLNVDSIIYTEKKEVSIDTVPPTVDIQVEGLTVNVDIVESEGDLVKYKVYMNDVQVYPTDGEPTYEGAFLNYNRTFLSNQVNPGLLNEVRVEAVDYYGAEIIKRHSFVADYVGLMFTDELGDYYSTDLGQVLKLLIMKPNIMAGASTLISKVRVVNKYPFPVRNVKLYASDELDHVKVLFSITETPFTANNIIDFGENTVLNTDDYLAFYVRVATEHPALAGEQFDIIVEAEEVS
ncbi:hypothetical protein [Metabacillus fastidiosus]|uniref:hypothetical protein n=1 Tax=Metabacillus fastidiosus TaxID=1458 RepID=UPI003D2AB099